MDAAEDVGHRDDRDRAVERREQDGERRVGQRDPLVAIRIGGASRPGKSTGYLYSWPVDPLDCADGGPGAHDRLLAHELRETLGRLVRRLRAEPGPPVGQLAVLGRLDRDGPASVSDLAAASACARSRWRRPSATWRAPGSSRAAPTRPTGAARSSSSPPRAASCSQTTRARREDWLTDALERELDAGERALVQEALLC